MVAIALPDHGTIRKEPKPREILEDGVFIFLPAALPVVVLDSQQYASARVAVGGPPHLDHVQYVPEVQKAGWRRRKSRDNWHATFLGVLALAAAECAWRESAFREAVRRGMRLSALLTARARRGDGFW